MIDRAVTSAEELLTLLTPKTGSDSQLGKQIKGNFLTTISFMPQGISFAPDTSAVLEELNGTVESIVSIAQQVCVLGGSRGVISPTCYQSNTMDLCSRSKINKGVVLRLALLASVSLSSDPLSASCRPPVSSSCGRLPRILMGSPRDSTHRPSSETTSTSKTFA